MIDIAALKPQLTPVSIANNTTTRRGFVPSHLTHAGTPSTLFFASQSTSMTSTTFYLNIMAAGFPQVVEILSALWKLGSPVFPLL